LFDSFLQFSCLFNILITLFVDLLQLCHTLYFNVLSYVVCVCCCPSILSLEDEEGYSGSLFPSAAAPEPPLMLLGRWRGRRHPPPARVAAVPLLLGRRRRRHPPPVTGGDFFH
jgi:hypothetical protein